MSIALIIVFMFGSMIALLITGRHIFIIVGSIGTIAALALWGTGGINMPFHSTYSYMHWYPILAIPGFVLMGQLLARSGMAEKLFAAIYLWIGHIRGGLGIGTVMLCSIVAAMSGTNVAATVTSATVAMPEMLKRKYDKVMVTGLIQAAGCLGFLIPPSIIFILYGMIAQVSVAELFIAGIGAGILIASLYVAYILIRCRLNPALGPAIPKEQRVSTREKFLALRAGILPILLIIGVLGLFFAGITTLMECSAVGAIGAIMIAASQKRLNMRLIKESLEETAKITSMFIWIFVGALLFSAVFDGLGAIHGVEALLSMMPGGRWGTLILMQLSFLGMGTVMDDTAMLLIVAPLYIPILKSLGFDLVWFGVLYTVNVEMAFLTPPFGYSLFIMKAIAPKEITIGDIYRSVLPFVGVIAIGLALLMAFPQIAMWLPNKMFP